MKKLVLTMSKNRGFPEPIALEYDGQILPVSDLSLRWGIDSPIGTLTATIRMNHVDVVFEEDDNALQIESTEQDPSSEAG